MSVSLVALLSFGPVPTRAVGRSTESEVEAEFGVVIRAGTSTEATAVTDAAADMSPDSSVGVDSVLDTVRTSLIRGIWQALGFDAEVTDVVVFHSVRSSTHALSAARGMRIDLPMRTLGISPCASRE